MRHCLSACNIGGHPIEHKGEQIRSPAARETTDISRFIGKIREQTGKDPHKVFLVQENGTPLGHPLRWWEIKNGIIDKSGVY